MSADSPQRLRPGCPVCGCPIAHEQARCAECRWPLHTEWRLGAPTPAALRDFEERLAAAQRERDLLAVVRAGLDGGAHIRGGTPSAAEWARARRVVEAPPVSDALLAATLDRALGSLRPGRALLVAEVAADGLTYTRIGLDGMGIPHGHGTPERVPWETVLPMLSRDPGERRFQLAGGLSALDRDMLWRALAEGLPRRLGERGDTLLLVHREIGWPVPDKAVRTLRKRHPHAEVVPAGEGGVAALLGTLIARQPLQHDVGLLAAHVEPVTRHVRPCLLPLFSPGAAAGAQALLSLARPPGDAERTFLAVVAARGDRWELLAAGAGRLPSDGRTQVRVVLEGPGRVAIAEPDDLAPFAGGLPDLLAGLPRRLEVLTEPLDLVCAVELGGPDETVLRRLELLRELVTVLDATYPGSDLVRVGVLGYRDHAYGRGKERRQTVLGDWLTSPAHALKALSKLRPSPMEYPEAAPVEDMLFEVAARLPGAARRARTLLLTVGARPPHPSVQGDDDVLPCQFERSWQTSAVGLARAGVSCAAVVDAPASRGHPVWDKLGAASLLNVEDIGDVDPRRLGVDLGLLPSAPQELSLPLADPERGAR
ncbi:MULTISPECIES: hypothetical protein [Actinomadura]|uniref:VWFA domain-containing protein n=1 Tax=Actinomadura yumaensis TaxID=111807 RepID=A0ABW2CI03_9ACTN|nr:hypothetical protein [Actinomadura sp. J1-007]MWK34662.1 hypothetical protein [Actinomadura sp. J1-007]